MLKRFAGIIKKGRIVVQDKYAVGVEIMAWVYDMILLCILTKENNFEAHMDTKNQGSDKE